MGLHIGYKCKCQQNLMSHPESARALHARRISSEVGSRPMVLAAVSFTEGPQAIAEKNVSVNTRITNSIVGFIVAPQRRFEIGQKLYTSILRVARAEQSLEFQSFRLW